MPVYGDLDPDWRYRQLANLSTAGSQVLGLVTAARERERLAEEEKRRRDVERFYQLARTDPEAARAYGAQLVGQLEGNERAAMEAALSAATSSEDRARPFLDAVARAEQERQAAMQAGRAPQSAPGPAGAMMGMGAQAMGGMAERSDPRAMAYGSLPFAERAEAREYFERRQMGDMLPREPEVFDPIRHLPTNLRALYASPSLPPDVAQGARMATGLEEKAGVKRGHDLQEQSQEFKERDLELRKRQTGLAERRERRLGEAQKAGGNAKTEDRWWKDLAQDAEISADLAARTHAQEANENLPYGERVVAKSKFSMTAAQRSKLISTLRSGVKEDLFTREQAEQILHDQIAAYQRLLVEGKTPYEAWKTIMGEAP